MASEGKIEFSVWLDADEAEKELTAIKKKIIDLQAELETRQGKKSAIEEELAGVTRQAKAAQKKLTELGAAMLRGEDVDVSAQAKTVGDLLNRRAELETALQSEDAAIQKINNDLDKQTTKYGMVQKQAIGAGKTGTQAAEHASAATSALSDRLDKIINRIKRLASRVLFFSLFTKAFQAFREYAGKALQTSDEFTAAVARLKGALLTGFQPIFSAVVPALVSLINFLSQVVAAVASFISLLFGSTVKASAEAASSLNDEANALEAVGGGAAKAEKQLASFDQINQLSEKSGGGGVENTIGPLFEAIKDFKMPKWVDELLDSLKITIKDVFVDWDNLTGEQIAEKVVTGLFALMGGVVGFHFGGIPGAIIGTLTGIVLGLVFNSMTFNHDGKINSGEILALLRTALLALFGAGLGSGVAVAIGASAVTGGLIGLTVGVGLALVISALHWSYDKKIENIAHNSELGGIIYAGLEKSKAYLEAATELRLNIESITGEIPAEQLASLERARDLINDIFDLDEKENKTPGEIAVIQAKISELNGMNLEGIQLQFDETTGHVNGTRDAILQNVAALQEQYKVEALHDAIVEQYKNEFEAKRDVTNVTQELNTAVDDHAKAVEKAKAAQDEYNDALVRYKIAYNNETEAFNEALEALMAAETKRDAANKTVEESTERVNNLSEALEESKESYAIASKSVKDLEREHENLIKKIADSATAAKDGGKDIMEGEKKGLEEGYPETEDFLVEAQKALQRAANDVNGIHSPSTVYEEHGKNIMLGLANGITNNAHYAEEAIRSVLNSLASIAERGINNIVWSFNNTVGQLNAKATDTGVTIPTLNSVAIPRLATGAVIPPNREFLAVLGDQRQGTNIETPLATMVAAFKQAMSESGGMDRPIVVKVYLDSQEIRAGQQRLDAAWGV